MRPILERSFHICYGKYACILPTRSTTLTTSEITKFPISPEIALELLMAAKFLDCVCVSVCIYIYAVNFIYNYNELLDKHIHTQHTHTHT